jgi:GAF domain-containing protein/sugar diacid utilization regulator
MASPQIAERMHHASLSVALAGSRADSVEQVLSEVVREGARLIGVERCGVYMREDREDLYRALTAYQGGHALEEDVRRWRAGVPADGLTSEVVRTRRPVIVANARQDSRMIKAAVRRWDIRSIMAVPMVIEDEVLGLLLMDDVACTREFSDREAEAAGQFAQLAAATVSQARRRFVMRAELDASRRHLAVERSATSAARTLSELLGRDRPLEELLEVLAEMLAKPCAIYRNEGDRVAVGVPEGGDTAAVPASLDPDFETAAVAHQQAPGGTGEAAPDGAVVIGPLATARLPRRALIMPLALGPERWGHLAVIEDGARLGASDLAVTRRVATLIALKGRLDSAAEEGSRDGRSLLAMDLMRGTAETGDLQRRARRHRLGLDARRLVLAIGPRDAARPKPDPAQVGAALRGVLTGVEIDVAPVGDTAAALIEVPRGADPRTFVEERLEDLEGACAQLGGDLVAGLSDTHRWSDGYRAARVEAMRVVACLRRFSPSGGPVLLTAAELGGSGLLLAGAAGDDIVRYAEETVGRLVEDPSSADLVTTLCAFFANQCSIRGTATALGVHENTVRYRLGRVEEGTGLPVSREPDAQLSAHLGLVVMRLQGRLGAEALAARRGGVVETDQAD